MPPAAERVVVLEQLLAAEGAGPWFVRELEQLPIDGVRELPAAGEALLVRVQPRKRMTNLVLTVSVNVKDVQLSVMHATTCILS